MISLYEFLSTKIDKNKLRKQISIEDLIDYIVNLLMSSENYEIKEDVALVCKNTLAKNDKFHDTRVFGGDDLTNAKLCEKIKFSNVFTLDGGKTDESIYKDIIWRITNGNEDKVSDVQEFDGEKDTYTVYIIQDYAVCIATENHNVVIELVNDINDYTKAFPELNSYYDKIELSNRKTLLEVDNIPDSDSFWVMYNELCNEYIKVFNKKYPGIELEILGNQGKHVCTYVSIELLHNYYDIVNEIDELQTEFVKELQDEIDDNWKDK